GSHLHADRETAGNAWKDRRDHEAFGSDRERTKRQIDERPVSDGGICLDRCTYGGSPGTQEARSGTLKGIGASRGGSGHLKISDCSTASLRGKKIASRILF